MTIEIAECCGSCIHSNKPKKPDETHAAHYEVSKTERWCFKHNCHTWREGKCEGDWEGPTRGTKTNLGRITKFNKRSETIKEIISKIGNKKIEVNNRIYFKLNNWLYLTWSHSSSSYKLSSKTNSHDSDFESILKQLNY